MLIVQKQKRLFTFFIDVRNAFYFSLGITDTFAETLECPVFRGISVLCLDKTLIDIK